MIAFIWMSDFQYILSLKDLIFEEDNMSSVPQAMFAAKKIRKNEEKLKNFKSQSCDWNPTKYNDKYMNSVWGMYNRYSVHNLKKVMEYELNKASTFGSQVNMAADNAADNKRVLSAENTGGNATNNNKIIGNGIRVPSMNLLYLPM